MKQSTIQIHDTKPSKKNPNAKYIVKSVGKNSEPLSQSEVLNDVKAVKTHIKAMENCWQTHPHVPVNICDCTRDQKFAKSGFASTPKLDKLKFTKQK